MIYTLIYILHCYWSMSILQIVPLHQNQINTKLSPIQIAEVLHHTHYAVFNRYPTKKRLAMAWAQIALENGRGDKIYNYNLGNIGSGRNQAHYYVAGSKFRSFSSFEESGIAYWNLLQNRCKISLTSFDWGNPKATAEYLRKCGYYRADLKLYQRIMNSLYYFALVEIIPKINYTIEEFNKIVNRKHI